MSELQVHVGCRTEQGVRNNNEDRLVVDLGAQLFLVADGMGGQEHGERASGLAAEIIPRVVQDRLAARDSADKAVRRAMSEANDAIVAAGYQQPEGRRMGTTAVVALRSNGHVVVGNLGDSRAYLVRGRDVRQITVDHSVAEALVQSGALTREEALVSRYQHVLHRFLGCPNMTDPPDVYPVTPEPGDRLLLATDGLTGHIGEDDLRETAHKFGDDMQAWADYLVKLALDRGSRDNVTCVVLAFRDGVAAGG